MIVSFAGKTPVIAPTAFVHPMAYVSGDVTIEDHVTVLPFASIRGEFESIRIGAYSNVQDNCSVHADPNQPMVIEHHVTIGHNTVFHGLHIGQRTLLGMGCTAVQYTDIGAWCLVGAGAVLPNGMTVPDRSLVLGMPAKIVGPLSEKHLARLSESGQGYIGLGEAYLRDGISEVR